MKRKYLVTLIIFFVLFLISGNVTAQTPADTVMIQKLISYMTDLEFQLALSQYVEQLFAEYGYENLPRERFLVSLMRLINNEMRERIADPREASDKYFKELYAQLNELQALKQRLETAGISELDTYINELQSRMKQTIKAGEVNYKKKKVFEDALQLLYVAEEMIKLDQLRTPENLNQKISSSKDKLFNVFGEVGNVEQVPIKERPTIFDLYEEWRLTETYKFNSRLLDVKIARTKLIKSGSLQDITRMFNNQLRMAYEAFNYFDYDLCDRLLEDLVETYPSAGVRDFEDVYFYWGESNFALLRLDRARSIYEHLLQEYPNTVYLPRVYSRLIQIAYKLDEPDELINLYSSYQNVASSTDEDYYDIQFIAALTFYNQADFNRAVDILLSFPKDNPFYYLTQYLVGTVYAAGQNYELAQDVFTQLVEGKSTPEDIYSRALYKLALIHYEQGAYLAAIEYLTLIPETYYRYDKVLNALAWAYFKFEQFRAAGTQTWNYSQAKFYARRLLDEFYGSEHRMEAESLLGYIAQLEGDPQIALHLYGDVYESKAKKDDVQNYLEEKDNLEKLYAEAKKMERKALHENNPEAYVKASDLATELEDKLYEMDLMETGAVGSAISTEIGEIIEQLDELLILKEKARTAGNKYALMRIDSVIVRLSTVLDYFPQEYLKSASTFNLFDAHPVTRKVAEYEFRNKKNSQLRQEILGEMTAIDMQISNLQNEVERKKLQGDYQAVVSLEQRIERLSEIRKKYDQLYAAAHEISAGEPYAEFDAWGDFGAFGMIDVNFGQRDRLRARMADVSRIYNVVTDLMSERRGEIEDRFKKIEAEIRFMTMKARLEERVRLRAERERNFRESYFDQRTSEFEEK
ncbi:MAG: hypothetical protein Kow0042_09830 [Calditrichia bacterium]